MRGTVESAAAPARFGVRWADLAQARDPLVLGVAPSAKWLAKWGLSGFDGARRYCQILLDVMADEVAAVKAQVPFFARFGDGGLELLREFVDEVHARGSLAVLDAKVGDADDTMDSIGRVYLGPESVLAADAVTASAFMGLGSLGPLFRIADQTGTAVLVLVRTSNHAADEIQRARTADGRTVAEALADGVAAWNETERSGAAGAVLGARLPESRDLAARLPNAVVEVPGLGRPDRAPAEVMAVAPLLRARGMYTVTSGVLESGPDRSELRIAVRHWRRVLRQYGLLDREAKP